MLENVPEIVTWGPLGEDGRPIPERSGETFGAFIAALTGGMPENHPAIPDMLDALQIDRESIMAQHIIRNGLGYRVEYRKLRSCDYGAPTTRERFYMIARCDGAPIRWPEPTHAPRSSMEVLSGQKLPYRTAAECIDWTIPAKSIFERDKPLAEATLRRIARGIKKFVIDNPNPYIVGQTSPMIMCNNENNVGASVESPLPTVTTGNRNYLVAPSLIQYHSEQQENEVRGQELTEPIRTLDTSNRYALSVAAIMKNYAGGYTGAGSAADDPLHTVTATDHNALLTAHILTLRNNQDGQELDEPLSTVTAGGLHHAEVEAFLVKYFSNGAPKPVDEPLDTITTKDRFAVVTIHGVEYVITDIRMRMLQPKELFRAQGFPEDYIIDRDADGNPYPKTEQVAKCGNAVTPPTATALVRANLPEYCEEKGETK